MATIRSAYGQYHITLSSADMDRAREAGRARFEDSRTRGLMGRGREASIEDDVEGCAAELAIALLLGQEDFVPTVGSFHLPDLVLPCGRGLQVRSTSDPNGGLIVRHGDCLDAWYVLLVGSGPFWTVVGANRGRAIMERGRALDNGREECRVLRQCALVNLEMIPWLLVYLPQPGDRA